MSAVSGTFTAMSSQFLHLMGAATGFIIGTVMVKKKWVDCENWDLFSVWQNRHMLSREQLVQESLHSEEGQARLASLAAAMRTKLSEYLAAGEGKAALAVHRRGQKQFAQQWQLSEDEQIQLITLLRKGQDWEDAVQLMVEYLKTPQPRETMVRAALAQILVERLNRPGQGLKVLNSLDLSSLGDKQRAACEALRQKAQRLVEDNPYEVTADW
jgi:hypothetical protein